MDADLVPIFGFILVIIVIVTLGINAIVGKHYRHKQWADEREDNRHAVTGSNQYKALEERVKVLERIATDREPNLAAQIEQLRDMQDIDTQLQTKERSQ